MNKYYSNTIRIISIITLIAFVSTQTVLGYEGRSLSTQPQKFQLRVQQSVGNSVGSELAKSVDAPEPTIAHAEGASVKPKLQTVREGTLAQGVGDSHMRIIKHGMFGGSKRLFLLALGGFIIILPFILLGLRAAITKYHVYQSNNQIAILQMERGIEETKSINPLLENAYTEYIQLRNLFKKDPFGPHMELQIKRIELEKILLKLIGSDIPKEEIANRFKLSKTAKEIFLTYNVLVLELKTFNDYDLEGYFKNLNKLFAILPDTHLGKLKILLIQNNLPSASSSQEYDYSVVTKGRDLSDIPHEIGHLVWFSNMRLNDDENAKFHDAFDKCKKYITAYAAKDALEDFAEMYQQWVLDTLAVYRYCLQEKTFASKDKASIVAKRFIFEKQGLYYLRTYYHGRPMVFQLEKYSGSLNWNELNSIFKKLRSEIRKNSSVPAGESKGGVPSSQEKNVAAKGDAKGAGVANMAGVSKSPLPQSVAAQGVGDRRSVPNITNITHSQSTLHIMSSIGLANYINYHWQDIGREITAAGILAVVMWFVVLKLYVAAQEIRIAFMERLGKPNYRIAQDVDTLRAWIRDNTPGGKEIKTFDFKDVPLPLSNYGSVSNEFNALLENIKQGHPIELRLGNPGFRDDKTEAMRDIKKRLLIFHERLSQEFAASYLPSRGITSTEMPIEFTMRDLFVNAFHHGNRFNFGIPIFMYLDLKNNKIIYYDSALGELWMLDPDRRLAKKLGLSGFKIGIKNIRKAFKFKYSRSAIFDSSSGKKRRIGTQVVVKVLVTKKPLMLTGDFGDFCFAPLSVFSLTDNHPFSRERIFDLTSWLSHWPWFMAVGVVLAILFVKKKNALGSGNSFQTEAETVSGPIRTVGAAGGAVSSIHETRADARGAKAVGSAGLVNMNMAGVSKSPLPQSAAAYGVGSKTRADARGAKAAVTTYEVVTGDAAGKANMAGHTAAIRAGVVVTATALAARAAREKAIKDAIISATMSHKKALVMYLDDRDRKEAVLMLRSAGFNAGNIDKEQIDPNLTIEQIKSILEEKRQTSTYDVVLVRRSGKYILAGPAIKPQSFEPSMKRELRRRIAESCA